METEKQFSSNFQKSKSFKNVIIILIGIIILTGVIGIFYWQKKETKPSSHLTPTPQTSSSPTKIPATPSITVLYPNGGETLQERDRCPIKWKAVDLPDSAKVNIDLFMPDTKDSMLIASNIPANQEVYWWKVTNSENWGKACLAKGTKVLMEYNLYKSIENIKKGDYVISYNFQKNEINTSKVLEVIRRKDPLVIINQKLRISPDQFIYTKQGFKQARDIRVGDYLFSNKGKFVKVYSIKYKTDRKTDTFDLVLKGSQNFFAENYLVHSVIKEEKEESNNKISFFEGVFDKFMELLFSIKKARGVENDYMPGSWVVGPYKIRITVIGMEKLSVYDESDGTFKIALSHSPQ